MTIKEKNELALVMGLCSEQRGKLLKASAWSDKEIQENYPTMNLTREEFNIKLIEAIDQAEAGIFLCKEFLGLNK